MPTKPGNAKSVAKEKRNKMISITEEAMMVKRIPGRKKMNEYEVKEM